MAHAMSETRALRAFWIAGAGFLAAAVAVAALNALTPFERGWWLTAYLFLVGSASQLLLGSGQFLLAARRHTAEPPPKLLWTQLALWNIGAATVAVADMTRVLPAVDAGSLILIAALALFLAGVRHIGRAAHLRAAVLQRAYAALLIVLAGFVVLGTFLAGALPGQ
ncbi:MAG: hypothetical protein ACR2J6_00550 [Thermoleophilaceae bacterium]